MYVSVTFHLVRHAIIFNSTVSYLGQLKIYSVGGGSGGWGRQGGGWYREGEGDGGGGVSGEISIHYA